MPPFKVHTDKPLSDHKKLPASARAKIMKVGSELEKMRLKWKWILDEKFNNHKVRPKDRIRCDDYTCVRENWPKIKKCFDELRATRDDLPWPECLPSGIWSCTSCAEYMDEWKAEYS